MANIFIVLAAGMGTRLRPETETKPKCMVPYAGKPLLHHQLAVLSSVPELKVFIAGGYKSEAIESQGHPVIVNRNFSSTNMVYTLFNTLAAVDEEVDNLFVSYGDIIFSSKVFEKLLAHSGHFSIVADLDWKSYWEARMDDIASDAESFRTNEQNEIIELGKRVDSVDQVEAQYIGLMKFSGTAVKEINAHWKKLSESHSSNSVENMYMTDFIQSLIDSGKKVEPVFISSGWMEFDTLEDLQVGSRL